jgi:hypothetical protein
MLQESVGWDPQHLIREPSTSFKVYVLFLMVVCGATSIKLIRIWRAAPPFRPSRRVNDPNYLKLLRTSCRSLSHWIGCTFLGWGILAATTLYDFCNGMMMEKTTERAVILFMLRDFSTALSMALWVALFVFMVRWHVTARIERLPD